MPPGVREKLNMFIIFLVSFLSFVNDTIYVNSSKLRTEQMFYFPLSTYTITAPQHPFTISDFREIPSLFIKNYSNLCSVSIRGIRTEDNSLFVDNIPLTSHQSYYFDISMVPLSLIQEVNVISVPLSSVSDNYSQSSGIFIKSSRGTFASITNTGTKLVSAANYASNGNHIGIEYSSKRGFPAFKKFSILTEYGGYCSMLYTHRDADVSGPIGSGYTAHKKEKLAGLHIERQISGLFTGLTAAYNYLHYTDKYGTDTHINKQIDLSLSKSMLSGGINGFYVNSTRLGKKFDMQASLKTHIKKTYGNYIFYGSCRISRSLYNPTAISLFAGSGKKIKNAFLYMNLDRGIKPPSFNDLYWPQDHFAEGNPYLKNERYFQAEEGMKFIKSFMLFSLNHFDRWTINKIIWIQQQRYKPYNIGKSYISGEECLFSLANKDIKITQAFSYQRFKDTPYLPHITLTTNFNLRYIWAELSYTGKRLAKPSSTKYFPDYVLLNAGLYFEKNLHSCLFSLSVETNNLLNVHYQNIPGYPGQSRTFILGLKIKEVNI